MAWMTKGSRAYEIQSLRRGRKVTSRYVGGGSISAESAEFFRKLEAGRRAERAAERAVWEAERDQLAEAERRTIEFDAAYRELAEAAMLAAGYHRPGRNRWRKRRRPMPSNIQAILTDPPLVSEAEMGNLLDRIEAATGDEKKGLQAHTHQGIQMLVKWAKLGDDRALPGLRVLLARRPDYLGRLGIFDFAAKAQAIAAAGSTDVLIRDIFIREIQATADRLAGPDPSPLEILLCQRVALAWFQDNHQGIVEVEAGEDCTLARAEFLSRQQSRATARFLAAARSLATVRRLALPVLQVVHVDASSATPPGIVADPSPTTLPRLRIGG